MFTVRSVKLPGNLGADSGHLIFSDGVLIAIISHLADASYGEDQGKWHVEASLSDDLAAGELIADLDAWIEYSNRKPSDDLGQ